MKRLVLLWALSGCGVALSPHANPGEYDESCAADSDCELVFEKNCGAECNCTPAASLNKEGAQRYRDDEDTVICGLPPAYQVFCECIGMEAACVSGSCIFRDPSAGPATRPFDGGF